MKIKNADERDSTNSLSAHLTFLIYLQTKTVPHGTMLDVSDSLQAETHRTAFYRLTLIFYSRLKHPGGNSCCPLAFLKGIKGSMQQLLQEVVVHPLTWFQVLVQAFLFLFHTSSCFIPSQLLLLQVFLISLLYCLVQLFPCVVLSCVPAPSQALLSSCSYLTVFWQFFVFSSSYHCAFQPPLPAGFGRGSGSSTG